MAVCLLEELADEEEKIMDCRICLDCSSEMKVAEGFYFCLGCGYSEFI